MSTTENVVEDDPMIDDDDDLIVEEPTRLTKNELRISKLHLLMVTRALLEGQQFLNESELLKVDPVTKAIVRGEIGYAQGRQPTDEYETTAELNAQLDLLREVVLRIAPKARATS
ncbi:MAG: hypothetical protein AB7L17_16950 [Ilumatobacteraceae bacterium]